MRELNHLHVFQFPLQPDNGLDLEGITAGLSAAAQGLQGNSAYVTAVERLGQEYFSDEGSLATVTSFPAAGCRHRRARVSSIRSSVSLARRNSTSA